MQWIKKITHILIYSIEVLQYLKTIIFKKGTSLFQALGQCMGKVSMQILALSALFLSPLTIWAWNKPLVMCQRLLPFSFFSLLFVVLEALAVCFLVVVFLETWIDKVHKSSVLTLSHILKKENLLQLIRLTDGLLRLIVFENGLFHSCLSVKAKVTFNTKETRDVAGLIWQIISKKGTHHILVILKVHSKYFINILEVNSEINLEISTLHQLPTKAWQSSYESLVPQAR